MLKICTEETAVYLLTLWKMFGILGQTPDAWNVGTMIPLYKRGPTEMPKSYRPICLLSCTRKVIEKRIERRMRREVTPIAMQTGFQTSVGVEMALAQTVCTIQSKKGWNAVFDLTSAYDNVPRHKLMELCDEALSANTAEMISHILQTLTVTTKWGRREKTRHNIARCDTGWTREPAFIQHLH